MAATRWSYNGEGTLYIGYDEAPGERTGSHNLIVGTGATYTPRVFYDGYKGCPVIPLMLPLHVEQDAVVADVLDQIAEVLRLIRDCRPTAQVAEPPMVDPPAVG